MKKVIAALIVGSLCFSTPAFADVKSDYKVSVEKYKADKKIYDAAKKAINDKFKTDMKSIDTQLKSAKSISDSAVKLQTINTLKNQKIQIITNKGNALKALGTAPVKPVKSK